MGQAGLVQGLEKLTINAPAIAHQKAGKVRSQYHRRLFKSTARLNRIDADLRGAEDPHPPQLSTDSPSGLIRTHTGTGACSASVRNGENVLPFKIRRTYEKRAQALHR